MKFLACLTDYLSTSLKLDKTRIFSWAEGGQIEVRTGAENKAFKANYNANIALSEFKGNITHLLYFISRFMVENQQFVTGSFKKIEFEYELLKRDEFNVFLSIPMEEIIKVTISAEGTNLDVAAPPDLPKTDAPLLVTAETLHTPGGET